MRHFVLRATPLRRGDPRASACRKVSVALRLGLYRYAPKAFVRTPLYNGLGRSACRKHPCRSALPITPVRETSVPPLVTVSALSVTLFLGTIAPARRRLLKRRFTTAYTSPLVENQSQLNQGGSAKVPRTLSQTPSGPSA